MFEQMKCRFIAAHVEQGLVDDIDVDQLLGRRGDGALCVIVELMPEKVGGAR